MSTSEEDIDRHAAALVTATMRAANSGPDPLPEDELAHLGRVIAAERQLLVDAMSRLLYEQEPEAATAPGVAEFDAGFLYGLAFARALDDAKVALNQLRRRQVLRLVKASSIPADES
jgi:hypothetical protein